ncbi:unnamed protein product [Psylliodes chrysocephalus]|uniref:DUF4371 domain-containing protein n=1 Tax=Psylliodes chrysocephalus TaxID=3402493 RepID=A0A9P0CTI5_9CUCU|nr:unnamed protein product [Psylliodes chrysocephala]
MQFIEDSCKAMISADMPLNKLNNVNLKSFLQNYCKVNAQDEYTLRKMHADCIYKDTMVCIKNIISDNFYIVIDEITNFSGRCIAHLLSEVLHEDKLGKTHVISSKHLEKTNNLTVTRFVQDTYIFYQILSLLVNVYFYCD